MTVAGIDDRQRAARLLLKHPLIRSSQAEQFRLVRRHAAWLREWFDTNTGWALHVDSAVARLAKEPATTDDATHPIRARSGSVPFSRRRYVLLMLSLAVLERSDSQISLGRLADQVMLHGGDPQLAASGFAFSLDARDDRSDLVAVVQALLDWGALLRVAGDEIDFMQRSGDALYDVDRRVLSQLLVVRRGPSLVQGDTLDDRLDAVRDGGVPPSDDLRNLRLRHSLTRRLLDEPVVYLDDLDDEELAYLRSQRAHICRRIAELTGLVAEVRQEGIALVDLDDDLTDLRMPERGTDGHVTLLIAEHMATSGVARHSVESLRELIRSAAPTYKGWWRAGSSEPGADATLVATAVGRLVALRLAERTPDGVQARPALSRFAVDGPTLVQKVPS